MKKTAEKKQTLTQAAAKAANPATKKQIASKAERPTSAKAEAPSEDTGGLVSENLFEGNSKVILLGSTKEQVAFLRAGIINEIRRRSPKRGA